MKKTIRQKLAAVLLLVMMMTVLCSCMAANTEMQVKQSGKAVISAMIMIVSRMLKRRYFFILELLSNIHQKCTVFVILFTE